MQIKTKLFILALLANSLACKPLSQDSDVKADKKGKTATIDKSVSATDYKRKSVAITDTTTDAPDAIKEDDGVLWKISDYWKVESGKVVKLKGKIYVDATSVFFSTKNDPRTTEAMIVAGEKDIASAKAALTASDKALWDKVSTGFKSLRKKEKMRVATNFQITLDNLSLNSEFWINAFVLGQKMYPKTSRTFSVSTKLGLEDDDAAKVLKPNASYAVQALGISIAAKSIGPEGGLSYKLPLPTKFEANIPVYGVPAAGINIKVGAGIEAEFKFNLLVRKVGMASLTITPDVKAVAMVGPGASAGPVEGYIIGQLTIFDAKFPVSASMGVSKTPKMWFGGVTYDGQELSALSGALIVGAGVSIPAYLKPFYLAIAFVASKLGAKDIGPSSIKWEHEIWASKSPWKYSKGKGYAGKPFLKMTPKTAAACKELDTKIAAMIKDVKGQAPKAADAAHTEVEGSIEGMLKKIAAKPCP